MGELSRKHKGGMSDSGSGLLASESGNTPLRPSGQAFHFAGWDNGLDGAPLWLPLCGPTAWWSPRGLEDSRRHAAHFRKCLCFLRIKMQTLYMQIFWETFFSAG